jgi:branched-chain amino acid transport system substrate-binding protein
MSIGSLVAGAEALGRGVMVPTGLWASTPKLKGPIKIGYQAVLSGSMAGNGEFHKMGALMAAEEINQKGGIFGNKLEIEIRDSTLKTDEVLKNAYYFIDSWGADFLAGLDLSGQTLALAPVMDKLDRILMVTNAATERLTEEWVAKKGIKQIFRICSSVYHDAQGAAFLAKDFTAQKWAAINSKNEYGLSSWKMFQETLKKLKPGVSLVAESWISSGQTDFRPHINTILEANPDGFYSTERGGNLINLIRQSKQAGLFEKIRYVVFPLGASLDVLETLGQEMPDNIWISGRYFFLYPSNKVNNDWVLRFRKRWHRFPSSVSENAYSSVYALKAALEKAGSKDTKALIKALEGMELETPAGLRLFRKEDHQAIYDLPWGRTKSDPKYPFKIMGETKIIPARSYSHRPLLEGLGSDPH